MKKSLPRTVASLSVCAALLLGASAASGAAFRHSNSATTSTAATSNATTTTTLGPWRTYRQLLATYIAARKVIGEDFRSAVEAAKATYYSALAAATTGAERSTASAAYDLAIAQAAATRSSALISLGNPPVRPT
jgi:hypothetical protein